MTPRAVNSRGAATTAAECSEVTLATASLYDIAALAEDLSEKDARDQSSLSADGGVDLPSVLLKLLATCSGCPASFQPKMPSAITLTSV